MSYFYYTYGLVIQSDLPLPELIRSGAMKPDVVVRLGRINRPPSASQAAPHCMEVAAQEAYFYWPTVGGLLVSGGNEVVIDPALDVEADLLRVPLLGIVLAVLLYQRGLLVLHASAVALGDVGAIFLGDKGQGKSTIAASLYARGHALLADDIVAIDLNQTDTAMILPGFPQFKLLPEAAAAVLGDDPALLPRLAPVYEKRCRSAVDQFADRPLPVAAIFVLDDGQQLLARRLSFQDALVGLIAQSFAARFGESILSGEAARRHLAQCAHLLRSAPLYRLERSRQLSLLPRVAELVEQQAAAWLVTA